MRRKVRSFLVLLVVSIMFWPVHAGAFVASESGTSHNSGYGYDGPAADGTVIRAGDPADRALRGFDVSAGFAYDSLRLPNATKLVPGGGNRIALGLGDNLDEFAQAQGALTYEAFPGGSFVDDFAHYVGDPANDVLFNLDGISRGGPWGSVQRVGDMSLDQAMRAGASITDWELAQIYRNGWNHVQFFEGGVPVPNPFGG